MSKSFILMCLCTVTIVSGEIVKNVPEPPAEIKSIPPPPMKNYGNRNNSLVSDERTFQENIDISREAKGIPLKTIRFIFHCIVLKEYSPVFILSQCVSLECADSSQYCSYWQQNWGCNYGSVGENCKETCNLCGGGKCNS